MDFKLILMHHVFARKNGFKHPFVSILFSERIDYIDNIFLTKNIHF